MATDIDALMRKLDLKGVNLLGHSMYVQFSAPSSWQTRSNVGVELTSRGGKAVMAFALNSDFNQQLRTLVSVDMSPAVGKISPEYVSSPLP